eukprot:CAMPEP_0180504916 /NCGR_PEP_ID=MMETSP1036_2-20121128/47043_1 /TAXON_ID=632150 /ORGANISM="Azadinium spinosum, Strain 3D9" /LENGTH=249 /DNA_ID=CAMNT_0022514487 /DNA_START=7 /DNA_END=757 /DNA_ORIENTATION=+
MALGIAFLFAAIGVSRCISARWWLLLEVILIMFGCWWTVELLGHMSYSAGYQRCSRSDSLALSCGSIDTSAKAWCQPMLPDEDDDFRTQVHGYTVPILSVPAMFSTAELHAFKTALNALRTHTHTHSESQSLVSISRALADMSAAFGLIAFMQLMKVHREHYLRVAYGSNQQLNMEKKIVTILTHVTNQYMFLTLAFNVAQLILCPLAIRGILPNWWNNAFVYGWTGAEWVSSGCAIYACFCFPDFLDG